MPMKEPRFHGEVTEKSHKNMSKIRGKDTSIEIVLRRHYGIRDFSYPKKLQGIARKTGYCPDKVSYCNFCDSEFFMEKIGNIEPQIRKRKKPDYWLENRAGYPEREEKDQQLNFMGWTVIHFWGKDILKDTGTVQLE